MLDRVRRISEIYAGFHLGTFATTSVQRVFSSHTEYCEESLRIAVRYHEELLFLTVY